MDIITINTCPTDKDILNCIDYEICKYDLHNNCIYADRCNALHDLELSNNLEKKGD